MEIFRYILYFMALFGAEQVYAASENVNPAAFTANSDVILGHIWQSQSELLLISLCVGAGLGLLWRKSLRIEDIAWVIVVIILAMGFACVLLRVKLGL